MLWPVGRRELQGRPSRRARYGAVALPAARGDVGGRAGRDHPAARVSAARAEVDDPVGGGDRVEVVLDQDHRVAGVDEPVQLAQQQRGVRGVQARGRLVEQVERVAAAGPLQLGGELDALGLAAAELGRRLAQPQVAQPHVAQRLQAARGGGHVGEERRGVVDGQREHVGDVLAAVGDLERLGVVARAVAGRARARRCRAGTAARRRRTPRPGRSRSGPRRR